jgi:MFS transporter, DHA3 family, macrolide efflux protein
MKVGNRLMLALLRANPMFLRYWVASWLSELGDWFRNMALMYMVLTLSNNSSFSVSVILFCEFAPIFIFGPLIGVLSDRWNRKKTILAANLLRIGFVIVLIAGYMMESLLVLYVGAFLCSLGTLLFRSPASAFMMQFVAKDDLKTAASLRQITFSSMLMLGPALGTLVYMQLGASVTLLVNVLLLFSNVLIIRSIRIPVANAEQQTRTGMQGIRDDFKEGFRYVVHNPVSRIVMLSCIFFGLGTGLIQVLQVFVITDFLGLAKEVLSIILLIEGAAMLATTFFIQKLKWPHDRFLSVGMFCMGVGFTAMVVYPALWALCVGVIVYSAGQVGINVGLSTLMQTKVDYAYQGRAGNAINTVFMGCMVISLISSGWLHESLSLRAVFAGGGIIAACGGLLCGYLFHKEHAVLRSTKLPVSNVQSG